MLKSHQDAFPPANYVGVEDVAVYRLDSVASEFFAAHRCDFPEIDVQAFEKQVLAGSETTLANSCVGTQLELSFLPLYEGNRITTVFIDPRDGRMLQADGVFLREKD